MRTTPATSKVAATGSRQATAIGDRFSAPGQSISGQAPEIAGASKPIEIKHTNVEAEFETFSGLQRAINTNLRGREVRCRCRAALTDQTLRPPGQMRARLFVMRVFISWSGERSRELASALKEWLPLVVSYVEPWLSDADIDAGERWGQSVAAELAASNFGIVCITSENVNSPWVLFEAGALTKSLDDSKVIPLLLDLEFSDISGPLAQFQAKKISRAGMQEIISSIQKSADAPIPEGRLNRLFEALWPDLEKSLARVPKEPPTERHVRPQHEVMEELVASVRSLDGRVRESSAMSAQFRTTPIRSRRRILVDLRLLEENTDIQRNDPLTLLVLASNIREEIPWLHELTMETYRTVRAGSVKDADSALSVLDRVLAMAIDEPNTLEIIGYEEDYSPLLRDLQLCARTMRALLPIPDTEVFRRIATTD